MQTISAKNKSLYLRVRPPNPSRAEQAANPSNTWTLFRSTDSYHIQDVPPFMNEMIDEGLLVACRMTVDWSILDYQDKDPCAFVRDMVTNKLPPTNRPDIYICEIRMVPWMEIRDGGASVLFGLAWRKETHKEDEASELRSFVLRELNDLYFAEIKGADGERLCRITKGLPMPR